MLRVPPTAPRVAPRVPLFPQTYRHRSPPCWTWEEDRLCLFHICLFPGSAVAAPVYVCSDPQVAGQIASSSAIVQGAPKAEGGARKARHHDQEVAYRREAVPEAYPGCLLLLPLETSAVRYHQTVQELHQTWTRRLVHGCHPEEERDTEIEAPFRRSTDGRRSGWHIETEAGTFAKPSHRLHDGREHSSRPAAETQQRFHCCGAGWKDRSHCLRESKPGDFKHGKAQHSRKSTSRQSPQETWQTPKEQNKRPLDSEDETGKNKGEKVSEAEQRRTKGNDRR